MQVSHGTVSLSYEQWEGLESHSALAYDVKFGWQSLVSNLQRVDAHVTQPHVRNAQRALGSHLLHFVFPVRALDQQQLCALNRKQNASMRGELTRLSHNGNTPYVCADTSVLPETTASWCLDPSAPGWCQRWRWCQLWQWCPPGPSAHAPSGKISNDQTLVGRF